MQFPSPVSLQWIAEFINAKLVGNTLEAATGINEIHKVEKGDLVFVDHPKYYDKCLNSAATFIIINNAFPSGTFVSLLMMIKLAALFKHLS